MSKFADRVKSRGGDSFEGQIGRLRAFRGARATDDHLRVLRKSSTNLEHARAIMDRVMEQCGEFPPPVMIAKIAGETPVPAASPTAPPNAGCVLCRATPGWRHVFLLVECRGGVPVAGGRREEITADQARDLVQRLPLSHAVYESVERCRCAA